MACLTFCCASSEHRKARDSYESAIKDLKKVLRKKMDLGNLAASKIQELADELKEFDPESDAVERIKSGFTQFKTETYLKNGDLFKDLAKGQSPQFLIFACSDSRVCPSHILNFQPGEAVVVRNIASMVPPFDDQRRDSGAGAAIEYAVVCLKVKNILVIGHSRCDGIKGLMAIQDDAAPTQSEFIEDWVKIGAQARDKIKKEYPRLSYDDQCNKCEKECVNVSLGNLLSYPFVREAIVKNKLAIRGGHYNFVNGTFDLWELNFKTTPAYAFS